MTSTVISCRIEVAAGTLDRAAKRIPEASLTDLTYRFPLGTVTLEGSGVAFSVEEVTVFDFARGMLYALGDLGKDGEAEYDFTEGEGSLLMNIRSDQLVEVTADFTDGTITASYAQISSAVREASLGLLERIEASCPKALRNTYIAELAAELQRQKGA
ncbi:hypothetical protein AB0945_39995 [Streptomyces sp. NPDC005474]|uniref:hypothetical protein n=1 Tax=Streptomyces sp. NPDC005474 TaxID=3154878 RepID=UPI0034534CA0